MPYRTPDNAMRRTWDRLKRLFQRTPEPPEDPYAYVGAPKKPRPPVRSSSVSVDPEADSPACGHSTEIELTTIPRSRLSPSGGIPPLTRK